MNSKKKTKKKTIHQEKFKKKVNKLLVEIRLWTISVRLTHWRVIENELKIAN